MVVPRLEVLAKL